VPKRIKITCSNCKKIIGERYGTQFIIRKKINGKFHETIIEVTHNKGGTVKITCGDCADKDCFQSTDITKNLEYCIAESKPLDK